jgi:hypothetical protein
MGRDRLHESIDASTGFDLRDSDHGELAITGGLVL